MMIGGGFILVFFAAGIAALVLAIVECVQASAYPEWAYERANTSKFVWQILPIILLLVCGLGPIIMYVLWVGKRNEVAAAAQSGPPPGYGYPPPGYSQGPPPMPPPGPPPGPPPT